MSRSLKKCAIQMGAMIVVVLAVMVIFKVVTPLKVAALTASLCFLSITLGIIWSEIKWGRGTHSLALWTGVLFFAAFVLPILSLRWIYWDQDFKDITILGFEAQNLHQMSSRCYLLLMGMVIYEGLRPHLPGRRPAKKQVT